MRDKPISSAEVDYLLAHGPHVIPVEVKAGATGRLKSMHLFLSEKNRDFGLIIPCGIQYTRNVRPSIRY
jgi:hypothetical protein